MNSELYTRGHVTARSKYVSVRKHDKKKNGNSVCWSSIQYYRSRFFIL